MCAASESWFMSWFQDSCQSLTAERQKQCGLVIFFFSFNDSSAWKNRRRPQSQRGAHVCIKWKPTSLLLVTLSDALLAVCNYNLILGWGFCVWSVRINKRPLKKLEHQYGRGAVWKKAVCWGHTFAAVINTTQSRIYFQTAGDPHWSWILRDVCTDPPPLQKRLHCLHLSKTAWKDLVCQSAWLFFFSLWKLQLCSTCLTISGSRLGAGKHDFRKFHFPVYL